MTASTSAQTHKNSVKTAVAVFALLSLASLPNTANAWSIPNTIQSQKSPLTGIQRHHSRTNRRRSRNFSLSATIEDYKSEEEQSSAPRRTRRIDDILEEYEATGDAGLTISILESTLKREQEKTSTLSIQLAQAERVINEQKKRLREERSFLKEKSDALLQTQRKLQELEQRMNRNAPGPAGKQQQQQQAAPEEQTPPWQQPPLRTNERQYPLITNWSINPNTGEITGSVSCHPSIPDGTTIVTSGLDPQSFSLAGDAFVYEADKPAVVVKTKSGSMYQLGVKKKLRKQRPQPSPAQQQQQQQMQERRRQQLQEQINPNISLDVPLTGESISNGRGTKYLLAGSPKRKPSGRSEIVLAYKCDDSLRVCDSVTPYVIKLSTNKDKLRREYENYRQVQEQFENNGGWNPLSMFDQQGSSKEDPFVTCLDFLPVCEGSIKYAQHSALVMEKGHEDLRDYEFGLQANDDPEYQPATSMDPTVVMSSLLVAAQCIDVLHSRARLVWTDLKAENLIFMEPQETENDGSIGKVMPIKGIDLESAIPYRGNPLDYTPEACPPEFAKFHLQGNAYDFILDYSYDVWSFGMLAYELATGSAYFRGKTPTEIMDVLGDDNFVPPLADEHEARAVYVVPDPLLRDLIRSCLQIDPRKRISVKNILKHPYFQQNQPQQQLFDNESGTFW